MKKHCFFEIPGSADMAEISAKFHFFITFGKKVTAKAKKRLGFEMNFFLRHCFFLDCAGMENWQ